MGNTTEIANAYLMFSALNEIMLCNYEKTSILSIHDPALTLKMKNLKTNFERESKRLHSLIPEDEYLRFNKIVTIMEKMMTVSHDQTKFQNLFGLVEAYLDGSLKLEYKEL